MRIWIDTEFNGFGGHLLSVALVAEDGSYLYEVLPRAVCEPSVTWVAQNVIPQIMDDPAGGKLEYATPLITVKHKVSDFLTKYDCVEIIADWPDDFKYLMELLILGPGIAIPTQNQMMFTLDRTLNGRSQVPHHAYYDALANMEQQLTDEYGMRPNV